MFYAGDEYADDDTTSGPLEWCEPFDLDDPDPLDETADRISAVLSTIDMARLDITRHLDTGRPL